MDDLVQRLRYMADDEAPIDMTASETARQAADELDRWEGRALSAKIKSLRSHVLAGLQREAAFAEQADRQDSEIASLRAQLAERDMDAARYFAHEFEVWQDDVMVASASGPRDDAMREVMHYAMVYGQDGPVRVFEVTRTAIDAEMAHKP